MDQDSSTQVLCALAAGSILKYASLLWMNKGKRKEYVGKISKLLIYPVKSMRGFEVQEADVTRHGLTYKGVADRYVLSVFFHDLEYHIFYLNITISVIYFSLKVE